MLQASGHEPTRHDARQYPCDTRILVLEQRWALHRDRVNVLAGTVDIVVSASEAGGWHAGPTKTGKRRTIVVPRFLAVMLGQHIGRYPSVDGWVFTAAEGGPVHHRNFRRRHFHDACVTAELGTVTKDKLGKAHYDGVRFHDLRHTAASLLIAADRSLQEVKDYLGHSSIRVTSDRYAHLYPRRAQRWPTRLDETFKNATPANLADFSRRLSRTSRGLAHLPNANEGRT